MRSRIPWMSRAQCCLCYLPFITIVSSAISIVGLALWARYSKRGMRDTENTLAALDINRPGVLDDFNTVVVVVIVVWSVVVFALLVLACMRSFVQCRVDNRGRASRASILFLILNAIFNTLQWLLLVLLFLVFGVWCVWTATAVYVDKGAGAAYNGLVDPLHTVKDIYNATQNLVTNFDNELAQLPTPVVNVLQGPINDVRSALTDQGCPVYCLNLASVSSIFSSNATCVCNATILNNASHAANHTWNDLVPALVGLLLMFIGGSWLAMNMVGQFSQTLTERRLYKRMPDEEQVVANAKVPGQRYYQQQPQPQQFMQV